MSDNIRQCPNPECMSDEAECTATSKCAFWFVKCAKCHTRGPRHVSARQAVWQWNILPRFEDVWISVEDELPSRYQLVLVLCEGREMLVGQRYSHCDKDESWRWTTSGIEDIEYNVASGEVTHWQPLPALPVVEQGIEQNNLNNSKDTEIQSKVMGFLEAFVKQSEALREILEEEAGDQND